MSVWAEANPSLQVTLINPIQLQRDAMLESIIWILLMGFFVGQIARRMRVPALVGMVLVGMVLGPYGGNVIAPEVLAAADSLRVIAVMVILMKAGLGLDREKLAQQGTVALRLGFLPAACEAIAIAFASIWLLQFDFATGLLLGCIIGAESPAVIVPGMLRLKSLGWGVKKGIPDAILTGSALSDVLLLLVFSLLLAFLSQSTAAGITLPGGVNPQSLAIATVSNHSANWVRSFAGLVCSSSPGLIVSPAKLDAKCGAGGPGCRRLCPLAGGLSGRFSGIFWLLGRDGDGLFFLIEMDAPLARRLRGGFDSLWVIAEIILFVLLGASIQLNVLGHIFLIGLVILAIGTLIGRSLGWYLSTLGSNWNWQERLFLLPGNSAKATVQAAIGAIPLAQGIEGGETILALAALSILVTAPPGSLGHPHLCAKATPAG